MSSVVSETSTKPPVPTGQTKGGRPGQGSGSDGFSELVDENIAATKSETNAPPQSGPPARKHASETQPATRSASERNSTTESQPTARSDSNDCQPSVATEADTAETPAHTLIVETLIKVGESDSESDETATPTDSDAPVQLPPASGSLEAIAVALQIELSVTTTTSGADGEGGEAPAAVNPPATVASPAETAANALARVASDLATVETGLEAETDAKSAAAVDALLVAAATDDADVAADAEVKTPVDVDTAAADTQLTAKANTELARAAEQAPQKPVEEVRPTTSNGESKLATPEESESGPATPREATPDAPDSNRSHAPSEAKPASNKPVDQPAEPETPDVRGARNASSEQPAATPSQSHATPSEHAQPSGFGVLNVAPQHAPASAAPLAQFAAQVATGPVFVPVNGLAVEIAANVQIGRSRFDIRLDPPELGRIDVRLDVDRQGQVTSHLIVEKSSTLDLLRRDAQQLERALQDAGLKTSDNGLQFSLRDQQTSGNGDDRNPRHGQRLVVTEEEAVVAETAGRSYGRMIGQRGGIDIRV